MQEVFINVSSKDSSNLEFLDLPFRLVVSRILCFIEIELNPKSSPFDLFGYFRLDRTRKIFFLFTSLTIDTETKTILNLSKTKSLRLFQIQQPYYENIQRSKNQLINIRRLRIEDNTSLPDYGNMLDTKFTNLITKTEDLQTLKTLEFFLEESVTEDGSSSRLDCFQWHQNEVIFRTIETFTLCVGCASIDTFTRSPFNPKRNFFCEIRNWKNLKYLRLQDLNFPSTVEMSAPKIIKIHLERVENLNILNSGHTLEIVNLDDIRSQRAQKFLPYQENLKLIYFSSSPYTNDRFKSLGWLFEKNEMKELKYLLIEEISLVSLKKISFPENLKFLRVSSCPDFDIQMLHRKKYPFLETLELSFLFSSIIWTEENFKFSFCKNLKKLLLSRLRDFNELFFVRNNFESLQNLVISDLGTSVIGKNWARMPKLKEFQVSRMNSFRGVSFLLSDDRFPKLENIGFRGCKRMSGKMWDPKLVRRLKKIRISNCLCFVNSFFVRNSFESLRELSIGGTNLVTGKNWNLMNNLRELRINDSLLISDLLFMKEDSFLKLEKIKVERCHRILGKDWCELPNLKSREIL